MNSYARVTIGLSLTSMFVSLLSIAIHLKIRKLLRHPGEIIMIQCICQLVLDVHWLESWPPFWSFLMNNSAACRIMGVFSVFASVISMNYTLFLCLEIAFKLNQRVYSHNQLRKFLYHFLSIADGVFIIVLALMHGDFGSSDIKTCSLMPTSLSEYIRISTFGIQVVLMWIFIFLMIRKVGKSYSNVIPNYFLVVFMMTLSVTVVNILGFSNDFGANNTAEYSQIALVIGSSTGITVGLSRLLNKRLIKHVFWIMGCRMRSKVSNELDLTHESDSLMSENIYNLGDLFKNLNKKLVLKTLSLIALRFTEHSESAFRLEHEQHFDQYEFDETLFADLSITFDLKGIKDRKFYLVYNPEVYLLEYFPKVFERIRMKNGIFDDNLYNSFLIPKNIRKIVDKIGEGGGRSEALIFFTTDSKYGIKTITRQERKVFINILQDYEKRVCEGQSRIVRVVGMFKLKPENQDFIIMENLVSDRKDAIIFDIKGSEVGRFVDSYARGSEIPFGSVLKDREFQESGFQINLSTCSKEKIIQELNKDFEMLAKHQIMDYSVIIAFYKKGVDCKTRYDLYGKEDSYSIGIIDFLQQFTVAKKSEKYLKKIIYRRRQISSEAPSIYKSRISAFISSLVLGNAELSHEEIFE